MKKLLLLAVCFLATQSLSAQKSVVKTFNPEETHHIVFDFTSEFLHENWEDNLVRIVLEVRTNANEQITTQLVKAGRYTLNGAKQEDAFVITAPKLDKEVTFGGIPLKEEITVVVKAPGYMELEANQLRKNLEQIPGVAARSEEDLEAMKRFKQDFDIEIAFLPLEEEGAEMADANEEYEVLIDGAPIELDSE